MMDRVIIINEIDNELGEILKVSIAYEEGRRAEAR